MLDDTKLIIGLSSVALGWLLAQFTGVFKDWHRTKKIKQCLIEELDELDYELDRTLLIYARQIQIHALKGIGNEAPTPISNHVFKNYYKDAVLSLNKSQRMSFQLIHTLIEKVNEGMSTFVVLSEQIHEKIRVDDNNEVSEKDGKSWGQKLICEYTLVATALWHVKFHLSNPKNPDLSLCTETHRLYLKYIVSVKDKIKKIMEDAVKLDRTKFDEIYNPEDFSEEVPR